MTYHYGRGSTMKAAANDNTPSDSNKDIGYEIGRNFFRNLAGYNDIESYTLWGLIDDIYVSLLCSKEYVTDDSGRRIVINRYYLQARKLQRLISVGRPPPYFVILLSDLSPKLKQALNDLDDETRNFVLNQVIGRIFENISPRLYHLSIARRLRWKLESQQKA
jgi:hypothetical protein